MITKEEVLRAFEIIEQYQLQEKSKILNIEIKVDNRNVSILGLSRRESNCLHSGNIQTIGDLMALNRYELRKFRHLGKKSIENINEKLKNIGVYDIEFMTYA